MKKLIFLLFTVVICSFAYSQAAFKYTTFHPTGSYTNTGLDTMTLTIQYGYQAVSIQPVITKTSGTVAGTVYLYYSVNGTNWVASGDSIVCTNQATNTATWYIVNKPCRYFKIISTGSGTMVAVASAKLQQSN